MASLRSLATRKATFFDALILIASPVAGLRPMRAGRLRTWKMPRPVTRTLLPFLRCFTTRAMNSSRAPVASFLVMPVFSANSAATLDSGTVGTVVLVAIVEGSLTFFKYHQRLPDAPGQRWRAQGYPRIVPPQARNTQK